jgi:hypothetical protein
MEGQQSLLRSKTFWLWCLATTVVAEFTTAGCRVYFDQSAAEFNTAANPPLVVKMHHMFWAIPLVLTGLVLLKRREVARSVFGASAGLVLSDLVHHFVVLPLWVGSTGWHWP